MTKESSKITLRETLRIHWRAFQDVRRCCYAASFAVPALHAAFSALSPYVTVYFSAQIINELAGQRRAGVLWPLVALTLGISALLTFLTGALYRWREVLYAKYPFQENRLFTEKLLSMDFSQLDRTETHDLLAQIRQSENWMSWGLKQVFYGCEKLVQSAMGILGAAALTVTLFTLPVPETAGTLAFLNHPVFLLLLAAVLLLATWAGPAFRTKAEKYTTRLSEEARFGNRLFQFFGYVSMEQRRGMDCRMYNQQTICRHYDRFSPFGIHGTFAVYARGPMGFWAALSSCVSAVLTGIIYVFVCLKAWAGAFGVGSVTQYVSSVTALTRNLSLLLETLGKLKSNVPFLRTVYEFLDIPNEMYQGSLTTEKRSDRQYQVEFRDVSFRYPGTDRWALRHVTLSFQIGSRMAMVGENGSGKTTFIKLLCRLYDPQEGQILLNGIDIRKYRYHDYMELFSVVFQDFQLLSQPLGANVAGSAKYDADRVRQALTDAGFGDRLAKMPDGLDTMLYREFAEDGVDVSGGEAQKIAIARALYKDAPFMILDEPTAALDPVAEAEIYSRFNEIAGDRTSVYISHRLSSCKFCDLITVFHDGRVVQQGSHEELLADKSGKYYELWSAQAQYYTTPDISQ